ncbi:glycoside hydrolase family 3 C-terminal domain-containing protein [Streptomyces sp. MUM 203J]|uniref:glycoside hydrolase family 3 protein n=1 Tax=Streptomyces sp. MUM 203J TaxID=2791990 RepID=UPI001F038D90|nr:glycoside hydrolase family 3 protein [Streptomyces sp. MUM 203J]MCH0540251.1 glycoside hydrolase family 3 C-terminal domain-containing protein [Streptomyces sp. MUM 203J]
MEHTRAVPSRRTVVAGAAALAAASHAPAAAASRARPAELVAGMSLEEKVGQLFVTRVYGHSATAPDEADAAANLRELGVRTAAEAVAAYHVGGVVYFRWAHNTRDPHQIADLSNGLQRAALTRGAGVPLLIATDQEHGIVARVGAPATLLPGAMALGAAGSPALARRAARLAGTELAALGIRQNYAPVADVNVNAANPVIGVRSFGADPEAVARLVAAQVRGYQDAGVAATAKHFPGHGDTTADSHTHLPSIAHSPGEWRTLDEPPFRAAVAAGTDAVMTAHVVVPSLDPAGDPATLSRPVLTGVLRERLGHDGVVVTDSLGMKGVRTRYGDARVPVLALKAGCDQLLNPPDLRLARTAVLEAVRDGELSEARLDVSVLRILRLKERLGLLRRPYVTREGVDRVVGCRAHRNAADRIADATTTLLLNDGDLLPLSRLTHRDVLVTGADPASPTGTTGPPTAVLAEALRELGFSVTALPTGLAPDTALIGEAVAAAEGRDAVVVGTYNVTGAGAPADPTAGSGPGTSAPGGEDPQRTLVARLAATGVPVVAVALRNPYDIAHLDGVRAALATYSWTDVELRAAARVIAGRVPPRGRLPVPVEDAGGGTLHPVGHGLSY